MGAQVWGSKPGRRAGGTPFARGEIGALRDKALCLLVSVQLAVKLDSSGSWDRSLPGAPMVGLKQQGNTQGSGSLWPALAPDEQRPLLSLPGPAGLAEMPIV